MHRLAGIHHMAKFQWRNRVAPVRAVLFMAWAFCLLTVSLGEAGIGNKDDLFDVCFPSATQGDDALNMGWACGRWGTILHTQNHGRAWQRQSSGTDMTLAGIWFTDEKYGWAVGDEGTILHTRDGGQTWQHQASPVQGFLMDVHFVNRSIGWIVTEKTMVLHTVDGGQTWQVQFRDGDFILKAISFCDEQTGWAVGEFGYIYHTRDSGKTWEQQAGCFDISDETGEILGGTFLFDVTAINPDTAWVTGMDGYVARTTDQGKTWTPLPREASGIPATHLFGISSDGSGRLLIAGNAVLLNSAFGWNADFQRLAVNSRLKYGWLYGVARTGPGKFVAVGKGGWIYLVDKDHPIQRVTISR